MKTDKFFSLIDYDKNMALAYMVKKMGETYAHGRRILVEIKYRFPDAKPKTFLDFGAGLGSGSIAFNNLYPDNDFILGVEPSDAMKKLGKFLTSDLENLTWASNLSQSLNYRHHLEYDIVYCGSVLAEIPTPEQRVNIIESLWEKVKPGGFFVLVEPGSPTGFRFVKDTRDLFVKMPREEANIVAPCPHHMACPLAGKNNSWCNFMQLYDR